MNRLSAVTHRLTVGKIAVRPVREIIRPVITEPNPTPAENGSSSTPISDGVAPSTTCRYSGRNVTCAVIEAPAKPDMALARQIAGSFSSPSGNSGAPARFSCQISASKAATDRPTRPSMVPSASGLSRLICSIATSSGVTKAVSRISPSPSNATRPPVPGRCGRRCTRNIASTVSGSVTRKIERQPNHSVRKPPATGPMVLPSTIMVARWPWKCPRSRTGTLSPISACDSVISPPPPRPCRQRNNVSTVMLDALAQPIEPAM